VEGYLIYILVIVTILLTVQVAVFVGLYFLLRRMVKVAEKVNKLEDRAQHMLGSVEPVLNMASTLMAELKEASSYLSQGSQNIEAITEMAKDEAADVRDLLGDSTALARREMERTRDRIEQVQRTLARVTDGFEETSFLVQQRILEPAREFSYIMFGIRRGLETLMAGNRMPVNRVYQEGK
jgi:uncharacterized protein YoxC